MVQDGSGRFSFKLQLDVQLSSEKPKTHNEKNKHVEEYKERQLCTKTSIL